MGPPQEAVATGSLDCHCDLEGTPRGRLYEALAVVLTEGNFDCATENACEPYYQLRNTSGCPSLPLNTFACWVSATARG